MELYFGMELPKEVLLSIGKTNNDLLEDLKLWGKETEEIAEHINESCLSGLVYIAKKGDVSLLFMDKTPYTIVMSILAPSGINKNKVVRHIEEVITMFKDKADVHKLEVFSTCPDVHWILSRCGFIQEGLLVDSRRLPDGEFIDEYCYGYILDV